MGQTARAKVENIFSDDEYQKLKKKIMQIETIEDAVRILTSLDITVQLCRWVEVDVMRFFMDNLPHRLDELIAFMRYGLNRDDSYIHQLKKVAMVFGDESKRYPLLSFWHHVILAYATADLTWEEIDEIAQQAIANYWSVNELRLRVKAYRQNKIISQMRKVEEEKGQSSSESQQPCPSPSVGELVCKEDERKEKQNSLPPVDILSDVKTSEELRREELRKKYAELAIKVADAYIRSKQGYATPRLLLEAMWAAFGGLWWEFVYHVLNFSLKVLASAQYAPTDYTVLLDIVNKFASEILKLEGVSVNEDSPAPEDIEIKDLSAIEQEL